jgi:regulator of protease activity HflC (stomatin/prohibitin superfamily)
MLVQIQSSALKCSSRWYSGSHRALLRPWTWVDEIQAKTRAEAKRREAETEALARKLQLEAEAEAARIKAENETRALVERQKAAEALEKHPGLLRLAEIEALRELARNANARVYLGASDRMLKISDGDGRRE